MSDYPATIYAPRAKENWPDVVYTSTKKSIIFKEDFDSLENEIKAIETELGLYVSGSFDNVKLRLENIESDITNYHNQGCKVYLTADQTLTHNTWQDTNFNNKGYDDGSIWDTTNKKAKIVVPGRYFINAQFYCNDADDCALYCDVKKNAASIAYSRIRGGLLQRTLNVSVEENFAKDDEIKFRLFVYNYTNGGNVVLSKDTNHTFASIRLIKRTA